MTDTAKVECADCDWTGTEEDCHPIQYLAQRVQRGEVVPAGECPKCGALCHLSDDGDAPADAELLAWPVVRLPPSTWRAIQAGLTFAIEQRQEELDHGDHDDRQHAENEPARADYQSALDALQAEIRG